MNRMREGLKAAGLLAVLTAAGAAPAAAEPLERLAAKIEKRLLEGESRKVAVLSFPYHDGKVSSGSSLVQERLTTYLGGSRRVQVIERKLLEKVLSELKLGATGLLDDKTTAEVGRVLGVGAVVTGTLHDLKDGRTEVNARLIETESGRILTARMERIKRSWTDEPVAVLPPPVDPAPPPRPGPDAAKVQLALLLDTSNSMDGLISQAKSQLWRIVNEAASARRGGKAPVVEVALYEYGNNGLNPLSGYIRRVADFTPDMDGLSEKLFALSTNGGEEYAGQAIQTAVEGLSWTPGDNVYRAVFIAGNEPFTQGPVDFREAAAGAKARGVYVNTIFCGERRLGAAQQWEAGALLAGGRYLNIDQDRRVAVPRAPQDDEIERLGRGLNDTYVPMRSRRAREAVARQNSQDAKAAALAPAGALVQRSLFKSGRQYEAAAAEWDLASAVGQGRHDVLKDEEALPEELRALGEKERREYVAAKLAERKRIETRIGELRKERAAWLKEQAGKRPADTLDAAVLGALREQAGAQRFEFAD